MKNFEASSTQLATTLAMAATTIVAYKYYKESSKRNRLGNFPSSSPWFLPFADLVRIIRAGSIEQFVKDRKKALNSDVFYMHLLGFTRQPTLVVTKPADFVDIMQREGKLNLCVDFPDTIKATHGPGNLQLLSGPRHNFLRKIFAKLLHPNTLEGFLPYFYEEFNKMWAKLDATDGEVIIQDAICEAQFFLMAKILYGMTPENTDIDVMMQLQNDFDLQMKGHFAPAKSKTHLDAKEASQRIRNILNPMFDALLEKRRKLMQSGRNNDVINDAVPVGNAMESIADALLKDNVQDDDQIRSDVYDNLNLLLEASHGTTMTVTATTLYYLNHPDNTSSLDKLRREMKSFKGPPTLSDLKNHTPIADGSIKEAMRLAPIVGNITYACKEDVEFTFKGERCAGPISFFLAFAHNYSDSRYFSNPECFVPERWVAGSDLEVGEEARTAYRPFGMGRHLCLGFKLAELVMKSAMYCFTKNETRSIKFDVDNVKRVADIFPAYHISNGFPGRVVNQ